MRKILKSTLLTLMTLVIFFFTAMSCSAADVVDTSVDTISAVMAKETTPEIFITGDAINLRRNKVMNLKAEVKGLEEQPVFTWSSSEPDIAYVDSNGNVKGLNIGRTVIKATAKVGENTIEGYYSVNVIRAKGPVREIFSHYNILSYRYDYVDDVYYTDDKKCWQKNFGFARIYDILAPYIALEYDYTRVFYTYDEKDYMVQLWKGQYGYLFYGGEIGIYSKPTSDKKVNMFTFFKTPEKEDWPSMEITLYHQKMNGEWKREFSREYDKYWWCTGFKAGMLRDMEPADELRLVGRITFENTDISKLFVEGLRDCGFAKAASKDKMGLDTYYRDGKDVYVRWQNISEAENTMPIKIGATALIALNFFAIIVALLLMLGGGVFLLGFLLLI